MKNTPEKIKCLYWLVKTSALLCIFTLNLHIVSGDSIFIRAQSHCYFSVFIFKSYSVLSFAALILSSSAIVVYTDFSSSFNVFHCVPTNFAISPNVAAKVLKKKNEKWKIKNNKTKIYYFSNQVSNIYHIYQK